jgi:VRR-NUC domain
MTEPTEKQIQAAVIQHWKLCGNPNTLVAAIPNAGALGQPGLTKGLSDLLVIGGNVGVGFIELKTPKGRLSAAQKEFLQLLTRCGIKGAVTFDRDTPIALLEHWGIVKQARTA